MTIRLFLCLLFLIAIFHPKIEAQVIVNGFSTHHKAYLNSSAYCVNHFDYLENFSQTYYLLNSMGNRTGSSKARIDSIVTSPIKGTKYKVLFNYSNNDISSYSVLFNNGNNWINYDKFENSFDSSGNLSSSLCKRWNLDKWDSLSQTKYFYNPDGTLSILVFLEYKDSKWIPRSQTKYTYRNNISEEETDVWNVKYWEKSILTTRFYSEKKAEDSIILKTWDRTKWKDSRKTNFYINGITGDIDSFIIDVKNGTDWYKYFRRTHVKSDPASNQVQQIDDFWNGNTWEHSARRLYSYIGKKYISNISCQIWKDGNWTDDDVDVLFKTPEGFNIGFITNNISAFYTNINNEDSFDFKLYQNFPNPFNISTTISYFIPEQGTVELKIFDILGREVSILVNDKKPAGEHKIQFDGSSLPSGVYIYTIQAGSYRDSKKLLLLK